MNDGIMSSRCHHHLASIADEQPQTPSPPTLNPHALSPSPYSPHFSPTTTRNTYLNTLAPFATPSPPARRCLLGLVRKSLHWQQPLSGGMATPNQSPGFWSIMKVSTQEQSLWRPAKRTGITKRPKGQTLFASTSKLGWAHNGAMPEGERLRAVPSISTWRVGLQTASNIAWTILACPGNYTSPTPSPSAPPPSATPSRESPVGLSGNQLLRTPPPAYSLPVVGGSFTLAFGSTTSSPFDSVIGVHPGEQTASPLDSTTSSPFESVIGDPPVEDCASPLDSTASSPFHSVIGDQPIEDCASPLYGKSGSYKMPAFDSPPPQAQMPTKQTPEIVRRARFFRKHHAEKDAKRAAAALPTPPASRMSSFSMSYRSFTQRRTAPTIPESKDRDDQIDNLIKKARHIAIESPAQKRARDAEARAQLQAEEAAAREAAEAKERAAIAKREAEEAAEQARLKAEEAARVKAQQRAARKHQVIYPIPTSIATDLETRLQSTRDSNALLNTIGNFDLKKLSYDRILAEERSTQAWLDDETVNAWFFALIQAIYREKNYTKTPKNPKIVPPAVAYNTAWWKAQRDKGISNISGWSRRQGIKGERLLSCEKIFFPINTGAHWTLLIISGTERTIEFLDSFGGQGEIERKIAREWLKMELGDHYVHGEWTDMRRATHRSQQQSNVSDCGMFACFNGLASAKQISYREVRAEKMREARMMMAGVLYHGGFTGEFEF